MLVSEQTMNAYKYYLAIKRHFKTENYDFFKFNGVVKASTKSLNNRNDKLMFSMISKKYPNSKQLILFYVSQFVNSGSEWIGDMIESDGVYNEWKCRYNDLDKLFMDECRKLIDYCIESDIKFNDLFKKIDDDYTAFLQFALLGDISFETCTILISILGVDEYYHKAYDYDVVVSTLVKKSVKYKPFLDYNETVYKNKLKKLVKEHRLF